MVGIMAVLIAFFVNSWNGYIKLRCLAYKVIPIEIVLHMSWNNKGMYIIKGIENYTFQALDIIVIVMFINMAMEFIN